MGMNIKDGNSGNILAVTADNHARTRSIVRTEAQASVDGGDGFNINTGLINLNTSTASAILYIQNDSNRVLVLENIKVGVAGGGTTNDNTLVTIIRNPTAGTIISNAVDVNISVNRNFSDDTDIDGLNFKGAEGNTITGGEDIDIIGLPPGGEPFFSTVDFHLSKGKSMAVTADTNTTSGNTSIYVAVSAHYMPEI